MINSLFGSLGDFDFAKQNQILRAVCGPLHLVFPLFNFDSGTAQTVGVCRRFRGSESSHQTDRPEKSGGKKTHNLRRFSST